MRTLHVTDSLILEIWPSAGKGDRPLLCLRSTALERGGKALAGQVVVYPNEIRPLVAALVEAAGVLAEWAT